MKSLNLLKERHSRLLLMGVSSKQHKILFCIITINFVPVRFLKKEALPHPNESPVSMTEPRGKYISLQPSALIDSQKDLLGTWSGGKVIFCIVVFILINP